MYFIVLAVSSDMKTLIFIQILNQFISYLIFVFLAKLFLTSIFVPIYHF